MTRQTIDVGIDLGTTNSCIAVMGTSAPQVVRNNANEEFTPSAVAIRKSGEIYVGRRAKDRIESDPDNAQAEFKRYMGFSGWSKRFTDSGRALTAPELSAEVLKALRADAASRLNEQFDAAVVTVPAAFDVSQSADTTTAATMAGFGASMLLQEPIAAAYAYGAHHAVERASWLVYDLGGGTFDAAVVRLKDGESTIVNHAGDNHLGGTRIDWDIVDRVLMPAAEREFGLTGFRRQDGMDPRWRGNVAKLKSAAEQLKIELSVRDFAVVDVALTDLDRRPLNWEAELTAGQLHEIAMPYYRRSIELCRKALAEARLQPADVDKVLLVGGSTLAPAVRELLTDPDAGLGIEIDSSLDPITVVATGASLYAAGQVGAPAEERVQPRAGEIVVDLRYARQSDDLEPPLGGQVRAATDQDWTGYAIRFSDPSGGRPWTGPMVPLRADGDFATDVFARPDAVTEFRIELFDPHGNAVPISPDVAVYRHTTGPVLDNTETLRRSVGLALSSGEVLPCARKGQAIDKPISGTHTVRTTETVTRNGRSGTIRIPIVQGERARADRNAHVGMIEITPQDVRRDVPAGTPVEVTVQVHRSKGITASAYVPLLDEFWDATVPLPSIPDLGELRDRRQAAATRRTELVERSVDSVGPEPRSGLRDLDGSGAADELDNLARTGATESADRLTLDDRLHEYEARLDAVEDAMRIPEVRAEIDEARVRAAAAVRESNDAEGGATLATIDAEVERATAAGDALSLQRQVTELHRLTFEVEDRRGVLHPKLFRELAELTRYMSDQRQATMLVAVGRDALAQGDNARLGAVNASLIALLPEEVRSGVGSSSPGSGSTIDH